MAHHKMLFYSFLFPLSNNSFIKPRTTRHPFFLVPYSLNHGKNIHCNFLTKNFFVGVLVEKYEFYHIVGGY